MRLLWKAQARPLNFESIYRRKKKLEKRDFRLTEETADEWKVELATQAMSIILDEILKAHQSLSDEVDYSGLTVASINRESEYRPLLPLALGALLQGEDIGKVLNEAKGKGYLGGADVRAKIAAFLETFREWAKSAAGSGQVPSVDEVLRVMNEQLVVNEQFGSLVPSETIRRHLATVASDILRLVSIPLDEVIEPIDRTYRNLALREISLTSFLNQEFLDKYFRGLEEFQDLAIKMFSWAALLQHIVNRLIGGWPHSLWRTVASDERFVSGQQVSGSYLPVFWWAAHFPSDRKGLSPSAFDKVEGGDEKIFEVLPLIGAVTAVGGRIVPNMASGWEIASKVKEAILGEFTGGRKAEAVIQRRDLPGCLLGVARNLLVVLEGLRSILEKNNNIGILTERLQAMPTVAEFFSSILQRLGYSLSDLGREEVRQAVIKQLETMKSETRQLMKTYWDEAKRIDESPAFLAVIDSILSGRGEVEIDLQRAQEIVGKINLMIVELASSSGGQWGEFFRGSGVSGGGTSFWGQVMRLLYGGYSTFFGVPLWTQSQRNIDEAVKEMINVVMTTDERTLEQKYSESVMDFKKLKSLIDKVIEVLGKIKNEVITEARRKQRRFLRANAEQWEEDLNKWIKDLSDWSNNMGKVLDGLGAPSEGGIGAVLENMKNVANGAQSTLKDVVTKLKEKLIGSWKSTALATAERLIENLSYVLSKKDATEFMRWLFGAGIAIVEFGDREIGGEVRKDEGEVIVAATEEVATSERLEEALFRLLGYVAKSWVEGDEVAGKFLEAINGLIDIFGVSQGDVHGKLLGILNGIERGVYVPHEVANVIRDAAQRIRFVQELKALLSPTSQQIEPLAPPPTGPKEWEEEKKGKEVEPEGEEMGEEGEVEPAEGGGVPAGGGALQEDEVGRGEQSGIEEENRGRLLLAKFCFLAKALRVFP
jgi:hypothetical protein